MCYRHWPQRASVTQEDAHQRSRQDKHDRNFTRTKNERERVAATSDQAIRNKTHLRNQASCFTPHTSAGALDRVINLNSDTANSDDLEIVVHASLARDSRRGRSSTHSHVSEAKNTPLKDLGRDVDITTSARLIVDSSLGHF